MTQDLTMLLAVALATLIAPIEAAGQTRTDVDLAAMPVGQPPSGFDFARTGKGAPGQWTVVADASAPKGRAVAQVSTDRTDYRFPLAIFQPLSSANVDVSMRFKPVSGKVDAAGGIALRLSSPDDYYVVRANALEDNVRFYRVVKGNRQQIAGRDIKVAPGEWHTLALRAEGDRFAISFDGKPLFTAQDKTFSAPGRVALWTKADSVTHFDSIAITALP